MEPHGEPLDIDSEDGHVIIEGGPGVAVTLTATAAADTSDRLLHHATRAAGQRTMAAIRKAEDTKHR